MSEEVVLDLRRRIEKVEARAAEHATDLAVIKTQLGGITRLLWMILGAVIVAVVTFLAQGRG